MTEIGADAFNYNPHLKVVKVEWATPPILGSDGFNQYTYFSALLQVPEQSIMAYKRAAEWCNFQNINNSSGIDGISSDNNGNSNSYEWYDLQGRKAIDGPGLRINPHSRSLILTC